jgi:hypothetical protein
MTEFTLANDTSVSFRVELALTRTGDSMRFPAHLAPDLFSERG